MAKRVRPIGHEDRLSIVDHLDELRGRMIACGAMLAVAFGVCFWQNGLLLRLLNRPLRHLSKTEANHLSGLTGDQVSAGKHLHNASSLLHQLATSGGFSPHDSALFNALGSELGGAAKALPHSAPGAVPITIGVGEPFTTTLTVCFWFAVMISLPVLLYQLYAFVVPALNPNEKRVATPVMIAAPFLFLVGVIFTYVVVLPAAIKFLQGYNSNHYNALVQAKPLYAFEVMVMAAIGLAFEMPLVLLGLRAAGIIDGNTLTRHWRYAIVILAIIAAAMPGADPVTTALETAPLVVLFVASIVLLKYADRREARRAAAEQLPGHDLVDV